MAQLRTRMNGGASSLKEVADAWKKEAHDDPWSKAKSDEWTVEFAKKLKDMNKKPIAPDPRNTHGN